VSQNREATCQRTVEFVASWDTQHTLAAMRSPRGWLPSLPILITVVLSLIATGGITYAAWRSASMHRRVAEDLLRGHALLAAQRYASRVSDELYVSSTTLLRPTRAGRLGAESERAVDPQVILDAAVAAKPCQCLAAVTPAYAFSLLLGANPRLTIRGAVDSATRAGLLRAITSELDRLASIGGWDAALIPPFEGDSGRSVFVARTRRGRDTTIYGFAADSSEMRRWVFKPVSRTAALIANTGVPNDSLVSVEVRRAAGAVLFRSMPRWPTPYRSSSALPALWRTMTVEVALTPRAVALLLPGGVPQSPVGLLLTLFGATAVLLGLAVALTWRTHQLAALRADFTSSVTHELRTPLTQILLYGETLAMNRARSAAHRDEAVGVIVREARRLIGMVENILHFSRAERRLIRLDARPQLLSPIVDDVVSGFRPIAGARSAAIEVIANAAARATVDGGAMRQILLNLLDNAVRYGPEGQTVRVRVGRSNGTVQVAVEDEGIGIPERDRERVWRPFVRLETPESETQTGSGIGLAVVKELTELQGGRCWVDQRSRGGASVIVELPSA
jgi:signal transduction histidine kinase